MVLDEPNENDIIEEYEGLKFIVSKDIQSQHRSFTIESVNHDQQTFFRIMPEVEPPSSGGCSSCTSCG